MIPRYFGTWPDAALNLPDAVKSFEFDPSSYASCMIVCMQVVAAMIAHHVYQDKYGHMIYVLSNQIPRKLIKHHYTSLNIIKPY
jgi:hypothetical protein